MQRAQRGFTLIEVLVAVVVVSLGMLGVAGTLLTATRSASSNYLKQQAVQYAYDMVDRIRANAVVAQTSSAYSASLAAPSATAPSPDCGVKPCTSAQMAAYDIWQWQTGLKKDLPSGLGSVNVATGTGGSTVTVVVQWSDRPAQSAFGASKTAANPTFTLVTVL
ncbi:MAG TPA: type IV pilus modification protein PilV [Frateuria sp.]|uniref:type IV pilus modification protein PilV n=1 Tax=Frateuria sp. TaxID=2211372 RepID=UPI002DF0CD5D|nr:type IV pilus modification protein PilV [Frateuria sp.]